MTEKPVGIHVVEMPNFTLRIFGRRSRFSKWYSHIAEVTPKLKAPRDLPERFDFKTVSIYPHPVCSQCSFRVPALWLSIKSPSRLVLSRTVAEKLIPSLARRELTAISNYKLLYRNNIWGCETSCKELIVHYIVLYKSNLFKNSFPLNDEQKNTILKWTSRHGGVSFEDDITIRISDWWRNYERAGWLLLALRIVVGEYIITCKEMEYEFQHFIENGKSSQNNLVWTGGNNWQRHFEKLPYFDGGMVPS